MENLNQIIKQFPEVGEVKEVKALTSGLINQTYLVKTVDPQEAGSTERNRHRPQSAPFPSGYRWKDLLL